MQKLAGKIRELSSQSRRLGVRALSVDVADQIKKLAELRDAGILTEGEFAEQKRKLLAKL
jgi:hypothetical protein